MKIKNHGQSKFIGNDGDIETIDKPIKNLSTIKKLVKKKN